jgi:hypothetical protein
MKYISHQEKPKQMEKKTGFNIKNAPNIPFFPISYFRESKRKWSIQIVTYSTPRKKIIHLSI